MRGNEAAPEIVDHSIVIIVVRWGLLDVARPYILQ